jgi:hypothetical protein
MGTEDPCICNSQPLDLLISANGAMAEPVSMAYKMETGNQFNVSRTNIPT